MNAKYALLEHIKNGDFALNTPEQIARKLRLGRREALGVRDHLFSLARQGELLCDSRMRFGTAEQFGAKRGKIRGHERGFGFFVPDDGSKELFLPRTSLKGALHGDEALAYCTGGGRGDEGEVLFILSRGMKQVVGTFRRERRQGYLVPDDRRFCRDILIPADKMMGCPDGKKAICEIFSYDGGPKGKITEILGESGELFTEENALIRAHELREEFPAEVLSEAEKAARSPILISEDRLDLRDKLIITVDGEDTRDIDDAISVERAGENFLLGVHIADVSHYVKQNSALDREAFARGTSVYFPDRVLPMLPKQLSNGICSLNEGEIRLTLSCIMNVDKSGKVLSKQIRPSVICSRHRMTYAEIAAIADGDKTAARQYPDLIDFVRDAVGLTHILKDARARQGGIDMEIGETKILYENGKIEIPPHPRTVAHDMIEQFMILANESVAQMMSAKEIPFVYRVHEKPSEEKAYAFREFAREIGFSPAFDPENVSPKDYSSFLSSIHGSPLSPVVNRVMLRSMMKAVYSPENIGHFGLASTCYCHFTSPIRRYPDLCIHRIIKAALRDEARAREQFKDFAARAAARSSACERTAAEAERDVDALYVAVYMQDKIGAEYEGVVSGVTSFGLFVELENSVEGLIPIETLPDDFYEFDENRFLLRGTKCSYRLGESVRVKVAGVDFGLRRTLFTLLETVDNTAGR